MKLYIVVAVWGNTKNNHAGMYYLARQIKEKSGLDVKIIPTPTKGSRFLFGVYRLINVLIGLWLYFRVKRDDVVFLMEYLLHETEQSDIARILYGHCRIEGIAHLVPDRIDRQYTDKQILRRVGYLDRLYVLGTSLRDYFVRKGVSSNKIVVTYHYVDTDYYTSRFETEDQGRRLRVICMGNMERNYDDLIAIIRNSPSLDFIVCMGKQDISMMFEGVHNVDLHGFLEERQLLQLMRTADISLNVMNDTVGSNVITTSLACGLPVIASNVGSIGDYVADHVSGVLFGSVSEATAALHELDRNRAMLGQMRIAAEERARALSLDCFIEWFDFQMNSNGPSDKKR